MRLKSVGFVVCSAFTVASCAGAQEMNSCARLLNFKSPRVEITKAAPTSFESAPVFYGNFQPGD